LYKRYLLLKMTHITKIQKFNHKQSSRLCVGSGILVGMGSVLNIAGNYFEYNYSESGIEADNKAIKRDWEMVGQELNNVISGWNHE